MFDLFCNPESLATVVGRSKVIATFSRVLAPQGFVEVETPSMQSIVGGAAARPFVTHHNTLDLELYLRIAPERCFYLKRLLVGGMERVFEIGRVYRNEGISPKHNPEFTMLEAYQAYGDYHTMMDLTESLICGAIQTLDGQYVRPWGDHSIDFTPPWPRRTYAELFLEHTGVDPEDAAAVRAKAAALGIATAGKDRDVVVSELFEELVEDSLDGPIFVIDYPAAICPLTKRKAGKPEVAERFELFVRGMELANAYTELNDPLLQDKLFHQQLAGQKEEDSMAKVDDDFIRALKHAMPPAGGLGIGMDRLCMLLMNQTSIRDVILFPLMRPQRSGENGPLLDPTWTPSTKRPTQGSGGVRVQVSALLALSEDAIHRAGERDQRHARRGDDDRRQFGDGRLLGQDAANRLHGVLADVVVESYSLDGFYDSDEVMARVMAVVGKEVAAMAPTMETFGLLKYQVGHQSVTRQVQIIGIKPLERAKTGDFAEFLFTRTQRVVRDPKTHQIASTNGSTRRRSRSPRSSR